MRPIQFNQDKLKLERKYLTVSPNTSDIIYKVREVKAKRPKGKTTKKRIATLLTEYYSILFNPSYREYFRPLTDLTLLFPTSEQISISEDTNFILLPLPLPTYRQHVQARHNDLPFRLSHPCPFLHHTSQANEIVHDMDYFQDNRRVMSPRLSNERNIANGLQHTNPDIKRQRLEEPLDITARIRVYKFDDLYPEQAKAIPTFPKYSMADRRITSINMNIDSHTREIQKPGMSEEEFKRKIEHPTAMYQIEKYNQFIHRQYTFLEITPANHPTLNAKCNNKLQTLSKYLEPSQLNISFADCFDFQSVPAEIIINYFMENMDGIEYNPTQIKSGIKRLKNIIKYMKPKKNIIRATSTQQTQSNPVKFNQHIRTLNIKQADGTFKTQVVEDLNVMRRTKLDDIKPLSINDLPSGTSQQ